MIILASDTSGKSISVALSKEGTVIEEISGQDTMQHASSLLPAINQILQNNDLSIADIDLFATTTGPGSFTGIRIGLSAVMGLAYGTGKRVYGVSSLATLAAAIADAALLVAPVVDARGGRVYSGLYLKGESLIEERPREISAFLEALVDKFPQDEKIVFVGDGSPLIQEYLDEQEQEHPLNVAEERFVFAEPEKNNISAAEIALLAQAAYLRGESFPAAHELEANYGIESSAKRNLKKKGDK